MLALLYLISSVFSLSLFGPDIQCTVIKVVKAQNIIGLKDFPKKYDVINNHGVLSKLTIRDKVIKAGTATTIYQKGLREKILIKKDGSELIFDLVGQPMSRQGTLHINNELVAQLTCH